MKIKIYPSSLSGEIAAPPSKSMAHRHIIAASLADGVSALQNIAFSDDINATIGCINSLGGKIKANSDRLNITGFDVFSANPTDTLFVNESGSTLRFLIPLCLLTDKKITFTGKERLFARPLEVYENICALQGICFEKGKDYLTVKGKLNPGRFKIPGNISSQFFTGFLFALPLLDGDSSIEIEGKAESLSYLEMTIQTLSEYGIKAYFNGKEIKIPGNQKYIPKNATVEGDYSNSAFFDALNHLGHKVSVTGLDENSLQGDKIYKEYFNLIGKTTLDLENCPDLAPILFALAAYKGGGEFNGTGRLKLKESDRGKAMAEELLKFGAEVKIYENSVSVKAQKLHTPTETLKSHSDHRIVMSLAVLCTIYGGEIEGYRAVDKSMPDFFDKLSALGGRFDTEEIYENKQ